MTKQKQTTESLLATSPFWLVAFVLFVVLVAMLANAWHGYNNTIEKEFRFLEGRALQSDAGIAGSMESANLMLSNLITDFSEKPNLSIADKSNLLKDALRQLPQLRSLLVTDSIGKVIASSNEQHIGFDSSRREYFTLHQGAPLIQTFHISAPFKTATGVFTTTVSRSLVDRNQRFVGVIVATFDSKYFERALEFHASTLGVQVTLVHKNGIIVSASPRSQLVGKSVAGETAFSTHLSVDKDGSRHVVTAKPEETKQLVAL